MSFRVARVAQTVRFVVSDAISNRVSDPRVNHFTSVTRVEVSADMKFADIHVSVMGTESESLTTMKGLESARGMIQTRLARQLKVRQCPVLRFHLDKGIKIGIVTVQELDASVSNPRNHVSVPEGDASDTPIRSSHPTGNGCGNDSSTRTGAES